MSSTSNNSSPKSRSASPRTAFPTNTKATSLCIPRVFKNITQGRIARCFALALGVEDREPTFIDRIDMVARTDKSGQEFWRVFIHLNDYPDTPEGREVQKRIAAGGTVTIVYDDPWYWKVSMSRIARPNQHTSRPRPYLATEGSIAAAPTSPTGGSRPKTAAKGKGPRRPRLTVTTNLTSAASNNEEEEYCSP